MEQNQILDDWESPILSSFDEQELLSINNDHRKRVFLNCRKLLQNLCLDNGIAYRGLVKNKYGKPFLVGNSELFCSVSHSKTWSIAMLSQEICGVDVELIRDKISKVFHKYSHEGELPPSASLKDKTTIWGIKEALFKASKESGIQFKDHMKIRSWDLESKSVTLDFLHHNHQGRFIANFNHFDDHVMAYIELIEQPEK